MFKEYFKASALIKRLRVWLNLKLKYNIYGQSIRMRFIDKDYGYDLWMSFSDKI
jgi:hypothetical protein